MNNMSVAHSLLDVSPAPTDLTVEQFCDYIAPGVWDQKILLTWPPDVFAVVAAQVWLLLPRGFWLEAGAFP